MNESHRTSQELFDLLRDFLLVRLEHSTSPVAPLLPAACEHIEAYYEDERDIDAHVSIDYNPETDTVSAVLYMAYLDAGWTRSCSFGMDQIRSRISELQSKDYYDND